MDCGATCLRIVARFYGKAYPAAYFRERCYTTREGVSMLGISDAVEGVGFRTSGVKITFEQLCREVNLPCIVHWSQNHFAVDRLGKIAARDLSPAQLLELAKAKR